MADMDILVRLKVGLEMISDPENNGVFQEVISGVVKEGIFTTEELADNLLVSKPSIDGWTRGKNLPRKNIRLAIYAWLLEQINKKIYAIDSAFDINLFVLKEILEVQYEEDIYFYNVVSIAINSGLFTEKDFAHEFDVSRSTVRRWYNGQSVPYSTLRPVVYKWLLKKNQRIRRISPSEMTVFVLIVDINFAMVISTKQELVFSIFRTQLTWPRLRQK